MRVSGGSDFFACFLLMRSFIAADLAAVNRTLTPWVIVGQHRMMYAPHFETLDGVPCMPEALLLWQHSGA